MSATSWFKAFGTVGILAAACLQARAADDIIVDDFAGPNYGSWHATGTAFGNGPVGGAALDKIGITNYGKFVVATSESTGRDEEIGTLISTPFTVQRPYLSFLISGGGWQLSTCLNLLLNGKVVHSTSGGESDRMEAASWDVSSLMGRSVQLQIMDTARTGWGHINVADIVQTDHPIRRPVEKMPLYREALRPQFHFTARQWTVDKLNPQRREGGWMNDPNGLVYYDHEYHLFAQRWTKCWIHAVSPDLVHWTELPPAFWEATPGSGTQSGTCIIDYGNTSGLSPDKSNPAMVCFWPTGDNQTQNISYSLDHGRTWKFYEKNPVLRHSERDPKVFWYEPTNSWVMFLYDRGSYHIFTSKTLLQWDDTQNTIPNSYECPDIFQLPLDGDKAKLKWVLIRGDGKYSIGDFDGSKFSGESPQMDSDSGPNFYATQSWENMKTGDGRRVQIAWMRGGIYPNMPFNQQMSFPRELTLRTTPAGPRLFREPIHEISLLHGIENDWSALELGKNSELNLQTQGQTFHILADLRIPIGTTVAFHLFGADLNLTHAAMKCGSEAKVTGELTRLEILVDRTSIEAFANHGEASLSRCYLPSGEGVSLECRGGAATVSALKIFDVHSAWPDGGKGKR